VSRGPTADHPPLLILFPKIARVCADFVPSS